MRGLLTTLLGLAAAAAALLAPRVGTAAGEADGRLVPLESIDLPRYLPPPSYREDLVVTSEKMTITMRRFVDHERIRTEMSVEGNATVMLETGDARGTTYTLMPEEKKAMKQSREAMSKHMPRVNQEAEEDSILPDMRVEDLGVETLGGVPARKLRMSYGKEGDVVGWFDRETGAPLRMESVVDGAKASLEWKNRQVEPQPEKLFVVPKDYELIDMDAMMAQMGAMGGAGAMAKGMAAGMAQGLGQSLGGSLGGTLGAALGGPLGAAAGQFIGGKIGGMLAGKAAKAVTP